MHVPDRPLDPPDEEELPEDEFICHHCGERRDNGDIAYTQALIERPRMTVEVCDRCATEAGLHQCKDCALWGDEETVLEVASDRAEWRCAKCAAIDTLAVCAICNYLHPESALTKEAGERLCAECRKEFRGGR